LVQVVTDVVWSDGELTMARVSEKEIDSHELYRKNLRAMVDLCPEGREINVFTESAELLREWAQMYEYVKSGFGNLTADQFPYEWQEIMKQLEMTWKRMTMQMGYGPREKYREAAKMYIQEKVGFFELVLGQPLDYEGPAEAPWN
jgi:hypothetical protein